MATIRKQKNGKWRAEIRQQNNRYLSKTFFNKGSASKWAKETEHKLEKESYEEFRDTARLNLGHLIMRYRDEITPNKKGAQQETYKLNFLFRQPITKTKLLIPMHIRTLCYKPCDSHFISSFIESFGNDRVDFACKSTVSLQQNDLPKDTRDLVLDYH